MPPCHGGGRGFESRPVRRKPWLIRGFFVFMAWYVYMIQSEVDGTYYKGSSEDPFHRLIEHNSGLSTYTSKKDRGDLYMLKNFLPKKIC